jgi:CRISPR-associated protein Cmr2
MAINFWKQKLLAFLHDPPNKALNIQLHEAISKDFLKRAGIEPSEMMEFSKDCDWTSAAADRFPFPVSKVLRSAFTGTGDTPFRHPLGGSDYFFERAFQSSEEAEQIFQDFQSGIILDQIPEEDKDWANFFLHWRRWPIESAQKDSRTFFLPADTRMPDHNIWVHNSITSALQGCVEEKQLKPAFLLFQMGPVQKFIEQARSTRDLWSGSYLLSWLVAHAIKAITDEVGPDAVIFPMLRAQPLFDFLHHSRLYDCIKYAGIKGTTNTLWDRLAISPKEILTPNLPNRFLALVPAYKAEGLAKAAENAVRCELTRIAEACFHWLNQEMPMQDAWRKRYDEQVKAFPQITWQTLPWENENVEQAIGVFKDLCQYPNSPAIRLEQIHKLATTGIPESDRDKRYFKDTAKTKLNNQGFAWPYYYALTDWLLAARRNTRDFISWNTDEYQQGTLKDSFSGIEEIIGTEDWWEQVREHYTLKYYFRSQDKLGALNLIKKVWHRAYLDKEMKLDVASAIQFESVPGVAAGKWKKELIKLAEMNGDFWHDILATKESIIKHKNDFAIEIPPGDLNLQTWLEKVDPECFSLSAWQRENDNVPPTVDHSLDKIFQNRKEKSYKLSKPPGYFAVIALDGDEMGKWVSGENTPFFINQLAGSAANYFNDLKIQDLEKLHRPLSPSYHLQFSEALSNFGLYLVCPIIEYFNGQLIYSGGDDVLAMVPASSALDCAEALYLAFRGQKGLTDLVKDKFIIHGTEGGFVRLRSPNEGQPNWPLVVPGPNAQASVGIAIGHAHSPLQNLVRAAKEAEGRAKHHHNRAACAVSLYKRSGEILEWGFKWKSPALELFRCFNNLSSGNEPLLSGRFSYALNEFIAPYRSKKTGTESCMSDVEGFDPAIVIMKEMHHVVRQQSQSLPAEQKSFLLNLCEQYLCHLKKENRSCAIDFPMLFSIASFLQRGGE